MVFKGRQLIHMIYDWMSLNQNLVGLYSITDLQNCVWLGDDKCGQFMKVWRRFTHALKEPGLAMETKRDLLMDKIPMESKAFGQLMVTFRKLKEGHEDFTLHYLEEMIDAHVKYLHELDLKSRRDAQAKRIATGARGADGSVDATPGPPNVKPKVKPKAKAKAKQKEKAADTPDQGKGKRRGRSASRTPKSPRGDQEKAPCWFHHHGADGCRNERNCKFSHADLSVNRKKALKDAGPPTRTRSASARPRAASPARSEGSDKGSDKGGKKGTYCGQFLLHEKCDSGKGKGKGCEKGKHWIKAEVDKANAKVQQAYAATQAKAKAKEK